MNKDVLLLEEIYNKMSNIQIIPIEEWPQGKADPTEYDPESGIIRVRSDYNIKEDPAGWIKHEIAHSQFKGSQRSMNYPNNPVEYKAYGAQLKYLKSKGYSFDDIFSIPTMEHELDIKDFLKSVWDKV